MAAMTAQHYAIWNCLLMQKGPINRAALRQKLAAAGVSMTDLQLRIAKGELIDEGYPIGSGKPGYFVIHPDSPLLVEACKEYRSRALSELRREAKIKSNVFRYWTKTTLFQEV